MTRLLQPDELFPAGRSDITQRFITLPHGLRVRVAESGPQDGTRVVCLPGWCCPVYMFRHTLDALPRHGLRVTAVDPRGFGLSDRPAARGAYTLDAYQRDLMSLLDALGIERAWVIGQSMGGGLALHAALRHSDRVAGIVLINPTGLSALPLMRLLLALPRVVARLLGGRLAPRPLVRFVLRYLAYGDPAKVGERDVDEYWSPLQLPRSVYAARASLGEFSWARISDDEAASLAVPALVILGKQDRLVRSSEGDVRRFAGAQLRSLPGGHCAHEEHPAEANRLIAEFVLGAGVGSR